ncbi:MAG: RdgB/HAM1 family non-canonical purine NTP pyrophosphatase [Saprospiraceae bacterium]|nr:RdgB/HAM1 family non-canonical purine NTP pyrophosphatase [Saprospiraceae bacterium]MDZ4703119.1 RdgB/HAM1 family non-canonical purine NTP pyrophosphatase [Saprospiraceae bacterium]
MNPIVIATNNPHKIKEIHEILNGAFEVKGLKEIGCTEELPETTGTIPGNAVQKARYVFDHYGVDCFAEDTGLEIDALNGAPGVDTAHYAGPERDALANMNLVLQQLEGLGDRSARFRTVIALILGGELHTFEGVAEGRIANTRSGQDGFGYDPIFIPEGHEQTFAELSSEIKNAISHRGRAMEKLKAFLMSD